MRCPLLGGSLTKIATFGTKNILSAIQGMFAILDVRSWEVSLYINFLRTETDRQYFNVSSPSSRRD